MNKTKTLILFFSLLLIFSPTKAAVFGDSISLSAPGASEAIQVFSRTQVVCQYVIANISSSVVVRLERSLDGTNWFNLNSNGTDTTQTTNGVYAFSIRNIPVDRIRFNFVSESDGTAATIAIKCEGIDR